jgi:signal transduction histidine kinase
MRLALRITLALLAGVLVFLIIDNVYLYWREVTQCSRDRYRHQKEVVLRIRRMWAEEGMEALDKHVDDHNRNNETESRVRVVSLTVDPGNGSYPRITAGLVKTALAKDGTFSASARDETRRTLLVTYAGIGAAGNDELALEVAEPFNQPAVTLRDLLVRSGLLGGATLVFGTVLSVAAGRSMFRRGVEQLIHKAQRVGQGDLSGPLDPNRSGDFGKLVVALNTMCDELSQAQERVLKETEARIAATEQLRHAERLNTVGRMAAGIAHELGTPLNVVSGRAGLIASGKLAPGEVKESAEIIKSETDRIADIIRKLLDFARPGAAKKVLADLRDVARETIDLLEPVAEKYHFQLVLEATDEPAMACIDVGQLQQVLSNLIVNAGQASPGGGKIGIRVDKRLAQCRQRVDPEMCVCVSVRDYGEGIPPENLGRIFEPFFTTKEVGKGTGLGLSVSYGIVEEHGGWIEVESTVGKGSCFTVFLPEDKPETAA